MPLAKISSARSRISSFVTVLLITRRRRSEPVSGAIVMPRSPLSLQDANDRLGQIVQAQRRRADRVAHLVEAREDALDVRMIAERDRDQPDAIARGSRAASASSRMRSVGKRADRQVVVAGPAEAAQVGAAADDLDEKPRAEFGVGREDARRRRIERIGRFHRGLLHRQRRARMPVATHADERAVGAVLRLVERRARKIRARRRAAAAGPARSGRLAERPVERGTSSSPSPAAMTSANGASGSGLTNVTAPPISTSGWRSLRSVGIARNARQAQHRQDVDVVPLEGDGKRKDVEFADRRLRLEGDAAACSTPAARRSSCFGGRNTRSHTMSSCALNRRYTVWKPRFDIPTQYVLGNARATRSRLPCGLMM